MIDKTPFLIVIALALATMCWAAPWAATRVASRERAMKLFDELGPPVDDPVKTEQRVLRVRQECALGFVPFHLIKRVASLRGIAVTPPLPGVEIEIQAALASPQGAGGSQGRGPRPATAAAEPPPLGMIVNQEEDIFA